MVIVPIQDLTVIEQLRGTASELLAIRAEIHQRYQQVQDTISELNAALASGNSKRLLALGDEYPRVIRDYNEFKGGVIQTMVAAHQTLCAEAAHGRQAGVAFPGDDAELWTPLNIDDYAPERIVADIAILSAGLSHLGSALEHFRELQIQITEAVAELSGAIARLERLGLPVERERQLEADLERRIGDPTEPREQLIAELLTQSAHCRNQGDQYLRQLLTDAIEQLMGACQRLQYLGLHTDEVESQVQMVHDQRESPDESLLDYVQTLLRGFEERIEIRLAELREHISERILVAQNVRASLDVAMAEAIALEAVIEEWAAAHEAEYLAYIRRLEAAISSANNAGVNALVAYEQSGEQEPLDEARAQLLGTAMLASAHLPDWYSSRLWLVGENILLNIMLDPRLDAQQFYSQFGYQIIARAMRAAHDRGELVVALGVFRTDFLPALSTKADQVAAVLGHDEVRDFFGTIKGTGLPLLRPEQIQGLSRQHLHGLLAFLEQADVVEVSVGSRLQWLTTLLSEATLDAELHLRGNLLLLRLLLASERYLSLYYALHVVGKTHEQVWRLAEMRPVLYHTIRQAVSLEADGKQFLIDLWHGPGPATLAKDDLASEALLAITAYYLVFRWSHTPLLTVAWEFWKGASDEYPTLSDLLLRQLNFEQVDADLFDQDPAELQARLAQTLREIEDRIPSPSYIGVRMALMIHNYYAEHARVCLETLKRPDVTSAKVESLAKQIAEQLALEDFVEECPVERPDNLRPVTDMVKIQVNSRIQELFELCQRAIDVKRRLLKLDGANKRSSGKLSDDLARLSACSESLAWAVQTLLEPLLPRNTTRAQPAHL